MRRIRLIILLFSIGCSLPVKTSGKVDCEAQFSKKAFKTLADKERVENELPAFESDSFLDTQAKNWANYNSNQKAVMHRDQLNRGPIDRLKVAGSTKRLVSENITIFTADMAENDVLRLWKGKQEQENLLNPFYKNFGSGLASFKDGCVFVVILTE